MPLVLANRVQETGTANTTVSFTLTGAVLGFQTFAVIGDTNTTYYSATDTTGQWEVGLGTYSTTGPTLTRTTIYASSNTGSAVTFSGTVNVFVTYPSGRSVNLDGSGNVSALGTVASGTWQGSTIAVAYGGTGVTSSSGANSVVLRDANSNITVNRVNQANTNTTAAGGTTALTAASSYIHTLVGTGGQTYALPDATTLTTGVAFVFNNLATGTLTITDYATATIGTIPSGGAGAVFLTDNGTTGGTWDLHSYLPEGVTFGTNAFNLGSAVISGGTWQGGTIQPAYGGTGLTTFVGANNALYSTGATTLTAGTLPVVAGGTGLSALTANRVLYASSTSAIGQSANLTFNGTVLTANQLTTTSTVTINGGLAGNVPFLDSSKRLTTNGSLTWPTAITNSNPTFAISDENATQRNSFKIAYSTLISEPSHSFSSPGETDFLNNVIYDISSGYVLVADGRATKINQNNGNITFSTSDFATAGNQAIWNDRIFIDGLYGFVGVNNNLPQAAFDVIGTVRSQTAYNEDAVALQGRAGGSAGMAVTLTPTTLTANRTLTLPDASGTVATTDEIIFLATMMS